MKNVFLILNQITNNMYNFNENDFINSNSKTYYLKSNIQSTRKYWYFPIYVVIDQDVIHIAFSNYMNNIDKMKLFSHLMRGLDKANINYNYTKNNLAIKKALI